MTGTEGQMARRLNVTGGSVRRGVDAMPSSKSRIRIHEPLPWTVVEDKESGGYVATNDMLNLTTQGDTWGELLEMIADVTDLLFQSLRDTNELEGFLHKRNLHFSEVPLHHEETFRSRFVDARSPVTLLDAA
jgi:predicted RNase H-like HicB family nuclease